MFDGQPAEPALELVAIDDRAQALRPAARLIDRQEVVLGSNYEIGVHVPPAIAPLEGTLTEHGTDRPPGDSIFLPRASGSVSAGRGRATIELPCRPSLPTISPSSTCQ